MQNSMANNTFPCILLSRTIVNERIAVQCIGSLGALQRPVFRAALLVLAQGIGRI